VWIARDGDALVVYTLEGSGKVKRLRRDPRVELRPCNRRGVVAPGAVPAAGTAEVIARSARHIDALRRKYGLQYRIAMAFERLTPRRGERVILRITLADPPS
jgi:PPOX class probable F420-dependent enzyme